MEEYLLKSRRSIFLLEKRDDSKNLSSIQKPNKACIVAGSEGKGIQLKTKGDSIAIEHNTKLESLNVAQALTIALYERY